MKRLVQAGVLLILTALSAFGVVHEKADRVVVLKKEHKLILLNGEKVIKTYAIALGRGGLSPKHQQGDRRTPEGVYAIDHHNPGSNFHRALHISYPNEADREHAHELGVNPGANIMIHGITNGLGWMGPSHRITDWTNGCIAVTNTEIDEIWSLVPDGTPVEIRP